MKSIAIDGTEAVKRLAIALTVVFAIAAIGIANAQPVAAVNTLQYDYTVAHDPDAAPGPPGTNGAAFWVDHFSNANRTNVTCTKYGDSHSGWLPGRYEAGVIKAGTLNYVWLQPDDVGRQLTAPKDLSHIFKCNWEKKPDPWTPRASLGMKCIDPTTVQVTYQYTTDGRRMGLTRSVTGYVFPAVIDPVNGSDTERYKVGLGNDGIGTVKAKFVLSGHDKRIVREQSKRFDCGGIKTPGNAYIKHYGPKGDPWYRFTMFNPTSRDGDQATCKVRFTGKNGERTITRKLRDGQGFKTSWVWVEGSTKVVKTCFEGGERVFWQRFRSAPPGYYGPLWKGYTPGYFNIR